MTKVIELVAIALDTAKAAVSYLSLLMHRAGIRDWGKNGMSLCEQADIEAVILKISTELNKR